MHHQSNECKTKDINSVYHAHTACSPPPGLDHRIISVNEEPTGTSVQSAASSGSGNEITTAIAHQDDNDVVMTDMIGKCHIVS